MEKNEKPLPRPPKTPFGRQRAAEDEKGRELLADKMAEAAALGNLDQLLDRELPDSEYARTLANMMMGMTGMLPQEGPQPAPLQRREPGELSAGAPSDVPSGVREAVQTGDVQGLIEMLRQEQRKRSGSTEERTTEQSVPSAAIPEGPQQQEKAVLDRLIALAREHNVSPDWIIHRALQLYFKEYERTGRL